MPSPEQESLVINSMIQGSHQAFEELYFTYVKAIHANISRIIRDPADIDDLIQEVFTALWQNKEKLDAQKGVADWLYIVSFNKSLKLLKKRAAQEKPLSPAIDTLADSPINTSKEFPSEDLLESRIPLIREAIELLPERKRTAFRRYKLEGNTLDEVASAMGISKATVKGYLKEARHFILTYIQEKERSYPIVLLLLSTFLY